MSRLMSLRESKLYQLIQWWADDFWTGFSLFIYGFCATGLLPGREGAEGLFTLPQQEEKKLSWCWIFFCSLAFLLTCKRQKLYAGWDHSSDLNLNVTIWVNSFAGSHSGSGLNFPEVQWPNLRKPNSPKTSDTHLERNSSAIGGATRWIKKGSFSVSQARLRLHMPQIEKLPFSGTVYE